MSLAFLFRFQAPTNAVRRTCRTLNALTISTACSTARPSSTVLNWRWSISAPRISGEMALPMSSPDYTTPYTGPVALSLTRAARLTMFSRWRWRAMKRLMT